MTTNVGNQNKADSKMHFLFSQIVQGPEPWIRFWIDKDPHHWRDGTKRMGPGTIAGEYKVPNYPPPWEGRFIKSVKRK